MEVDKEMTKNMATVKGNSINAVNSWTSQIVGKFGRSDKVMLAEKKCSCKYFDHIKIFGSGQAWSALRDIVWALVQDIGVEGDICRDDQSRGRPKGC